MSIIRKPLLKLSTINNALCQAGTINNFIIRKMCDSTDNNRYNGSLITAFHKCVESVKPKSLFNINKCMELVLPDNIRVCDEFIDIKNRQCHLVGFGKAVFGMAVCIERVLGDRLVSGIISVPIGTVEKFHLQTDMQSCKNSVIQVYEGAKNNLPDLPAQKTAKKILEFVHTLTKNDVLFVLISGGGSALLPASVLPITLSEKVDVIKMLASSGADINELNTVRTEISSIKGGKLALASRGAYKVVSLIISDICGDPLHLIASGPTIIQESQQEKASQILEKYNLMKSIPSSIKTYFSKPISIQSPDPPNNSSVYIIGNNSLAINVALEELNKLGFRTICMSKRIEGNVKLLSSIYCDLAEAIYGLISGTIDKTSFKNFVNSLDKTLKFEEAFCLQLFNIIMDTTNVNPICLVSGGETTVNVKGKGIGGRNQELVLRIANNIRKKEQIKDIVFLSAGTDGIDGPCDAAGGIATLQLANDCKKLYKINDYIENNDSYNVLKNVAGGKYQIITGHTGTNVMDLHFMVIPLKSTKCKL